MPLSKLDDFAETVISPALSTISGVGQVQIFGSQKYAVRVELDPNALAARGIGIDEIQTRDRGRQRQHAGRHASRATRQNLTIQANTQLRNADAFRDIIVAVAQRQAGAPRRRRDGHRLGREHRRPRAGMTASRARARRAAPARRQHRRRGRPGQGDAAEVPGGARAAARRST